MFSFRERKEFHFTFDNRVFWFKLDIERHMKAVERVINERNVDEDEARKIALKESGAVKKSQTVTQRRFITFETMTRMKHGITSALRSRMVLR